MLLNIIAILYKIPLAESDEMTTHSSLRGSLLFEQLAYRPITVNPQYFNFYRQFNISHIQNALEILEKYENLYAKLCNDISLMPELSPEFYKIPSNTTDYHTNCIRSGGYLPEIRTKSEAIQLAQIMKGHNITQTPAGIDSSTSTLFYRSDKSLITEAVKLQYCTATCPLLSQQLLPSQADSLYNNNFKIKSNMAYYKLYDTTIIIAPANPPISSEIICMKNREVGLTALHFMLRSSCNRDTHEIREQNKLLALEVSNFLSPQHRNLFNLNPKDYNEDNHRSKRAILPLVSLFLLGGAVTQKSPLDAIGSLGASIFGLGSKQDMIITKQKLEEHATQIGNLAINQELITKAINDIQIHINSLTQFNSFASHKIAQAYAELDNKGLIRHLQNLIQLTLLKMQSAVNSATQAIPSPYVFSNKDLQNITHTFRMNEIMLTTNLNEISASILLVDNQITFMFNVPVNDDRNKFQFYEIRQLPVYINDKSYKVEIENNFIGINDFTNEYMLLSQTEFQRCLIMPICILPSPFIRITETSPCEILTFKDNVQTCPIKEIPHAPPVFYTYKNTTIYSIPNPIQIHITCKQGRQTQSSYKRISGMGTFDVTPGCTIHIPPDTNIRPEYMIGQEYLKGDTLMGTINEFTKDSAFLPLLLNVSTSTLKPLKINEISNFKQGIDLIFNHEQLGTEVVRILAYCAIAIVIIYSMTCCFPKFKLWLKSFFLITKPEKYWGMRKYIIPSPFIRKSKINNPPSDPLETYMSTFRQRLAKILNRPSQSENFPDKHKNFDDVEMAEPIHKYPPEYNNPKMNNPQ